jgi:hypothetical protein
LLSQIGTVENPGEDGTFAFAQAPSLGPKLLVKIQKLEAVMEACHFFGPVVSGANEHLDPEGLKPHQIENYCDERESRIEAVKSHATTIRELREKYQRANEMSSSQ